METSSINVPSGSSVTCQCNTLQQASPASTILRMNYSEDPIPIWQFEPRTFPATPQNMGKLGHRLANQSNQRPSYDGIEALLNHVLVVSDSKSPRFESRPRAGGGNCTIIELASSIVNTRQDHSILSNFVRKMSALDHLRSGGGSTALLPRVLNHLLMCLVPD